MKKFTGLGGLVGLNASGSLGKPFSFLYSKFFVVI